MGPTGARHAQPVIWSRGDTMPGVRVLAAIVVVFVISSQLVGCSDDDPSRDDTGVKTYSLSANTPVVGDAHPGASSLEYARKLGGVTQSGKRLWVILGRTAETEAEAQEALDAALPTFGDMQSYFIVQHSDGFEGLPLGQWVVIEAYEAAPSSENLDLARRGFADADVAEVTVKTGDPVPVYEQVVDQ